MVLVGVSSKNRKLGSDIINKIEVLFSKLRSVIKSFLRTNLGLNVSRNLYFDFLVSASESKHFEELQFLKILSDSNINIPARYLKMGSAQLHQDLLALATAGYRPNGFFVEIGATDGKTISNTFFLEKEFGWEGILCEPTRFWHDKLRVNRTAKISTRAAWSSSNQVLKIIETSNPELSTIDKFRHNDFHSSKRVLGVEYNVMSISLNDLLELHSAPKYIDFISIDTEGSEFEIVMNFDFTSYKVGMFAIEHNYSKTRKLVHKLMERNNYERKYSEISGIDDWYFPKK
jgi:FkbM family methyltransferase